MSSPSVKKTVDNDDNDVASSISFADVFPQQDQVIISGIELVSFEDSNRKENDTDPLNAEELFIAKDSKKHYRKIYCCFGSVILCIAAVFCVLLFWLRTIDPCKLSLEKCGIFTDVEYLYSTKLEYKSNLRLCSVIHSKSGNMCQDASYATEVYFKPLSVTGQSSRKTADEAICKIVAFNESDRNSTSNPANGTSVKDYSKKLFYRIQFKPDTKIVIAIEGSSEDKSGLSILRSIFDVPLDVEVKSARTPRSLSVMSFSKPPDDIYTESYSQEITLQYNSSVPANDTSVPKLAKNATTNYENNLLYNKTSKKIDSAFGSFFYSMAQASNSSNNANSSRPYSNSSESNHVPTTVNVNSTLSKQLDDYDPDIYLNMSSHDSWVDLFYAFTHVMPSGSQDNSSSSDQNGTELSVVPISNSNQMEGRRNLFSIEGEGFGSARTFDKDFHIASTQVFGLDIAAKAKVDATICIGSFTKCSITETPQKVSVVAIVFHPRDKIASSRSAMSPQCNHNCKCLPDLVFNGGDGNDNNGPDASSTSYRSKLSFDIDIATQSVSAVQSFSQDITVYELINTETPFCRISTCPAGGCNTVRVVQTISDPSANTYGVIVEGYLNPVVQGQSGPCSMDFTFRMQVMFEKGKGRTIQMLSTSHYDGLNYGVFAGGTTVYRFKTAISQYIYFFCPRPGQYYVTNTNFQYYDLDCQCRSPANKINAVVYFDLYIDSYRMNVCTWSMDSNIVTVNPGIYSQEMELQAELFPPQKINPNYGVCIPTPWGFCVNFVIGFIAEASGSYNTAPITAQLQYGFNSFVKGEIGISIWIFSISVVATGQLMNALQEYVITVKGWDNLQLPASSYLNSIKLCTYSYIHMLPISAKAWLEASWDWICCCRHWCSWFLCIPYPYVCRQTERIGGEVQLINPIGNTVKHKVWDNCLIDPSEKQPPLSALLAPTFPPTPAPVLPPGGEDTCFPSSVMVKEKSKGFIRMQDLEYGDWVEAVDFSGSVVFKEVFLFGHKDANPSHMFQFFNFAVGRNTLSMSGTHYARLCVADCSDKGIVNKSYKLINVYARDVKVGDIMLTVQGDLHDDEGGSTTVSFQRVEMLWISTDVGLHNPYILGADIIVNGVVASVHAVHYVSNYYSPVLCTIYPLYKIIGPKYMHILVERLQIHDYTGSIRHHYFAAILVHLLPLIPVLYLLKKWTTSSLAKK